MKKIYYILAILTSLLTTTTAFGQTSNSTGVQAIDIGLSVRWADRNVGASSPSDYGDYYAWGEIETKENYEDATYKWCKGWPNSFTKYNTDSDCGVVDNKTTLEVEDDVAHVKLGEDWRLPTLDELAELCVTRYNSSYKWEWKSLNGHNGWQITYIENNNSIFLPAAGYRHDTSFNNVGSYGCYRSSILYTDRPGNAWFVNFSSEFMFAYYSARVSGLTIRPVTE